jgi:hypothetical protein
MYGMERFTDQYDVARQINDETRASSGGKLRIEMGIRVMHDK